jgi:hypothetical protein
MNSDTEEMCEHLDNLNKTTQLFKCVPVQDIHIFFLYVINQKLENFCRMDIGLKSGKLSKNDLLAEILKRKKDDGRNFHITGLYTYNWTDDLKGLIRENEPPLSNCFQSLSKLEDIVYVPAVSVFQDYSSLFVLLQNEKSVKTKRTLEQKKNKTIRKV